MLDSKLSKTVYEITPGSTPLGAGYQISFTFFSNDQIKVYLTNGLTQTEVDSSKYSIVKSETIYKVVFISEYIFPSDAIRLVIAREVVFQQNTNLINGELIDAEVLERALDIIVSMGQQLKEITDRAVLSPISENAQTIIPEKSDRAGRILGFDEHGEPKSILTSDIDQKLKQSLSAQEQVILLSTLIEGYRDQAYQSAINAQTSEENVLVKEEQVSGTLVQIQNIKQQIDNIENAVKLSEANAVEASNSASESANTASISESNARISESKSKESERNAASSASAALSSENNAKESEANAKNSENASAQSASNALSSENNVVLKEEQISGILTQIQNIKQQIDDIKSAVELSETNAAESSSSAAESANAAKDLLSQADLNLIESIEQTKTSTESGGENQVTITQKNGNKSLFSIRNGEQGPAVPLVQTTGTSTTSAMSQKAVTDALNNKAPQSHSHVKQDITDFAHNHDDRYYTEDEVNTKVNELKSDLDTKANKLNVVRKTMLWTNSVLSSGFEEQEIIFSNLSKYDAIEIIYIKRDNNNNGLVSCTYYDTGLGYGIIYPIIIDYNDTDIINYYVTRKTIINIEQNKIIFSNGAYKYFNNSDKGFGSVYCIPCAIYGVKIGE